MPERAAIMRPVTASDGLPSTSIDSAKVHCPECTGWQGTVCPHGCGVRLVSTQAAEDAALMERLRREQGEREAYRAQRRAERASSGSSDQRATPDQPGKRVSE